MINKTHCTPSLRDKLDFKGKTILVTGGSKGIGQAIVKEFAQLGARVFYTCRKLDTSVDRLVEWANETQCAVEVIQSDACDSASYEKLYSELEKRVQRLDVLVNNVGDAVRRSPFFDSDDGLWRETLDVNLMSAVRATRTLAPLLKKSSAAVIVNMSSIAAKTGGGGDSLHYAVSKGAIDTFTRGLVSEFKGFPVRVVGVAPSAIDTEFQQRHSSAERLNKIIAATPQGRIGMPEEIADVVIFLASKAASYINGETIMVSGGRL